MANEPLNIRVTPEGVRFAGGSFEERVNATVEYIIAKNGGAEAVAEILNAYGAANPTSLPMGNLCGTSAVIAQALGGGR